MIDGYSFESILVADCGSTQTRVILIDVVEDRHRFVAKGEVPSTVEPPWSDVTLAVRRAIGQIEEMTGRLLLDDQGQLIIPEQADGQGVDAFVATISAGEPLHMVLVGLARDLSLASARRASSSTYAIVEDMISLDDSVGERRSKEAKIRIIYQQKPDVVLITGGTDGGTTVPVIEMAEVIAMACSLLEDTAKPHVIFAGNSEIRTRIAEIIGEETDLKAVDNVRPALNIETLAEVSQEIERLYQERKMSQIPGFSNLSAWGPVPILPTAKALGYVVQYLARQWDSGKGVIAVDIGGTTTTVAAVVEDRFSLVTRSDLGMGCNIDRVLGQVDIDGILRWLPFGLDPAKAHNIILNKKLRPTTVPQTREELLLEQAVAREVLRLALTDARAQWPAGPSIPYAEFSPLFEPIISCGGVLAHAPHHGQAALILLDALQPIGVSTIVLDATSLAAPLGVLATLHPLAATQVIERDAFLNLGTVVAPVGMASEDEIILRLKMMYSEESSLEVEVAYGSLEVLPLPLGQKAILELEPLRGFDVGWGRRAKGVPLQVNGGTLGVIIDARGRPLSLPEDKEERRTKMQKWLWDMGSA